MRLIFDEKRSIYLRVVCPDYSFKTSLDDFSPQEHTYASKIRV